MTPATFSNFLPVITTPHDIRVSPRFLDVTSPLSQGNDMVNPPFSEKVQNNCGRRFYRRKQCSSVCSALLVSDARSSSCPVTFSLTTDTQARHKRVLETRLWVCSALSLSFSLSLHARAWHRSTWRYEEGKVSEARALPGDWTHTAFQVRSAHACTSTHAQIPGEHIHILIRPRHQTEEREEPFGEPRISSVKISTYFLDWGVRWRFTAHMGGERWKLLINRVILLSRYRPLGREKHDYYLEK